MQQAEINALKDYNMMSFMDNKEHEDAMKKKAPASMQKKRTFGPKEVKSILPGKGKMAKGHSIYEHQDSDSSSFKSSSFSSGTPKSMSQTRPAIPDV